MTLEHAGAGALHTGCRQAGRRVWMLMQVTVWFPAQFAELRRICLSKCGGEAAFCASLSRCHRSAPSILSYPQSIYVCCP